jgi:hypothetical protein
MDATTNGLTFSEDMTVHNQISLIIIDCIVCCIYTLKNTLYIYYRIVGRGGGGLTNTKTL